MGRGLRPQAIGVGHAGISEVMCSLTNKLLSYQLFFASPYLCGELKRNDDKVQNLGQRA
jgi:hypothetical protein